MICAEKMLMINPGSAYQLLCSKRNDLNNESKPAQIYYQLLLFRAQDLCYIPHKSEVTMSMVVQYYQKKNDYEHLMQAYYCMGCIYRDWHEAPRALNYYHRALNVSSGSENYAIIARIYNQMGQLELEGNDHELALSSFKSALVNFKKANDSITIPYAIRDIGKVDEMCGNNKMSLLHYLWAYKLANRLTDESKAAMISLDVADVYIKLAKRKEAEYFLNRAFYSKCLRGNLNLASYYINRGILYNDEKNPDSAMQCLHRAAALGNSYTKEGVYELLYRIYKDKSDVSSALKYLELYEKYNEENLDSAHGKEVLRMQSLYNYNRTELKNQKLFVENEKIKQLIMELIAVIFLLIIGGLFYRQRNVKKQYQRDKMASELIKQYRESQEYIDENNKVIEALKKQLQDHADDMKSLQISTLEMNNAKAMNDMEENEKSRQKFRCTPAYSKIHQLVADGELLCSHNELNDHLNNLMKTIDLYYDNFSQRLRAYYPRITPTEMTVCYLMKAELSFQNMAVIMSLSKQSITNIRSRLNQKCFEGAKSTKQFDQFIYDF